MRGITYGAYVWFPILATLCWLATLISLLLLWTLRDGAKQYDERDATVVFISDVGAAHKALFVPLCACVFLFYSLSLFSERWLRHVDRIPGTVRSRERNLDVAAVAFGTLGGFWLLMLSIFDSFNHSKVHWSFTCLFIVCVATSAVCQTFEIVYLKQDHPDRAHLRRTAIYKFVIVAFALCLAIAFGTTYAICKGKAPNTRCDRISSTAGVLEWLISFVLAGYFLTFVVDLWPAVKTSPRHIKRVQRKNEKEAGLVGVQGEETTPRGTIDSAGVPDERMVGETGLRPVEDRRW